MNIIMKSPTYWKKHERGCDKERYRNNFRRSHGQVIITPRIVGFFKGKKEMVVVSHNALFTIIKRVDYIYIGLGDCAFCVYVILSGT
jgi:hypothetical protein